MSEIVAVLVVPAEGDPGGLLARPRIGACCPGEVYLDPHFGWSEAGDYYDREHDRAIVPRALALWLDALVPEGWDRARRVIAGTLTTPGLVGGDCVVVRRLGEPESLAGAQWLAAELVDCEFASRVVRLARVDGRLVEVEP